MECIICNKWIKYKKNWIRHCSGQGHIKRAILQNDSDHKVIQSDPKSDPKSIKSDPKVIISDPKKKMYNCDYCSKTFTKKTNKYRHQRTACKVKKEQQATTIINNNTTNNTNNNTQVIHNHVHINVYGNEDFSKLMSPEFFEELKSLTGLRRQDKMITHMYTAAPNNTARIPNMNQPYCITMGEEGEIKQSLKPVIENILEQLPENTEQMFINYIKALPNYFAKKSALVIYNEILKELKESISNATKRKEIEKIIKAALYNN